MTLFDAVAVARRALIGDATVTAKQRTMAYERLGLIQEGLYDRD